MSTIGERIAQYRVARGMTQAELGEAIGESKQTIYKYEHGIVTNIPISKVVAIARVLHCPPIALAGWEEKKISPPQESMDGMHKELNAIFDSMSPALQSQALAVLRALAQSQPGEDSRGGSD